MTNQDHLWGVLDDLTELFRENGWPTPEKGYKLDGGWPMALADLKKYIGHDQLSVDQVMAERDAISKRLEQALLAGSGLRAERDALASQNARLRAELETFANNSLVGAIGREDYGILHDEIVDWFSASDFLRAAEVLNLTPRAALEELRRRERSIGAEEEFRSLAQGMDKHTRCTETGTHRVSMDCLAMRRYADAIRDSREKGGAE